MACFLGGDGRTELFLAQVRQALQLALKPVNLNALQYPSGTEARGSWIDYRVPALTTVKTCFHLGATSYVVEERGELVAALQINADIDLMPYIFFALFDSQEIPCFARGLLSYPVDWPEGFPDASKHPGDLD